MSNPWGNTTDITRLPVGYIRDMIELADADLDDEVDNLGSDANGDVNIGVGIYCETAGTVVFKNVDGNNRTVVVAAGGYVTCSVKRVMSTGTTASLGIHVLIA